MNFKSQIWVGFTALAVLLLTASPAWAELNIVTTTTDLGDFAKTIGGDRVTVDTIVTGAQDPHYGQARPSYMVKLSRADLLLSVGLELEVGWLPSLVTGSRNPKVNPGNRGYFEAGTVITPLNPVHGHVDRSHGDIHPQGNPHFWLDPENARIVVTAIAARMAELDPKNAEFFRANAKKFDTRIQAAMKRWTTKMAPYRGTKIVSYHRTFNYFFKRFGLVGAGYVEDRPGIPPAPAHLAALIRQLIKEPVPVIFHENYSNRSTSDMVASRTKARVLVLPTSVGGAAGVTSYEKLIDHLVNSFVAAVKANE